MSGCVRPERRSNLLSGLLPVNLPDSACHLPPVNVSPDREIRTVVGLRPYRPKGFRVELETIGDKRVVHNYGHGGGGLTLSWGTARLAVDLGAPGHVGPVAVLGCGAVGLATARLLQEAGFVVSMYAKALPPETTSNIAGGEWGPSFVTGDPANLTAAFQQQFDSARQYAYTRFQTMVGQRYGIRWMRKYIITPQPIPESMAHCAGPNCTMPELRRLAANENPFKVGAAAQFDEMLIEPPIYLPAMIADVRQAGGRIVVREIHSMDELQTLSETLIINCTGLGARSLFHDEEMTPMRGQLTFLVPQPEVTYATGFNNTYMFSRTDGILLGGTHEIGDWSLEPDLKKKAEILQEQANLFQHMRSC